MCVIIPLLMTIVRDWDGFGGFVTTCEKNLYKQKKRWKFT